MLFLGAGSVIIALHHEQDMRKMGGLRKYMPITYLTMLIGALANAGFPPFAGFFSKDTIIEAVHASQVPGAGFAYLATLLGVFVGGFYSFRLDVLRLPRQGALRRPAPSGREGAGGGAGGRARQPHQAHDAHGTTTSAHDDHGHAHGMRRTNRLRWSPCRSSCSPSRRSAPAG